MRGWLIAVVLAVLGDASLTGAAPTVRSVSRWTAIIHFVDSRTRSFLLGLTGADDETAESFLIMWPRSTLVRTEA